MNSVSKPQPTYSRRAILHRGGALSILFGLGIPALSGSATARKAELVEAIASKSGLSKAEAQAALDAFIDATTKALANGDSVLLPEFGLFSVSQRVKNGSGNDSDGDGIVDVDECPELAAALDLGPGKGDQRRNKAGSRCRSADVVVDADRIATDTRDGAGLSKADAKKALDGFVSVTTRALQQSDTVSLVGFGSFSISKRSARTGRNPQTGKEIQIAAKNVVKFKAGAELSKAVN
ncbi:HU family DNA-binding protein [Halovenus marina]|uniref:HU family DNA-binding protein n=1 Tax=Halovenus marina TaxID=3396621 RepID=UPI003F57FD14